MSDAAFTPGAEPELEPEPALPRGALGAWWAQGWRTALLRPPRWAGLPATPLLLLVLVAVALGFELLVERLCIVGEARFHWPALMTGWLDPAIALWACWLAMSTGAAERAEQAPGTAALFAMLQAQLLGFSALSALLFVPLVRSTGLLQTQPGQTLYWGALLLVLGWLLAAQWRLVWRCGTARPARRGAAMAALGLTLVLHHVLTPAAHWYPAPPPADAAADKPFKLTQELMELQASLLHDQLQALKAGPPGQVNLYSITFAPYASEDVFMRESALVDAVMQQRFGAAGRSLQLINHADTARTRPWATPHNLRRAIQRAAALMNRDDDVLFIHLTSHGARDGQLAAELAPMTIDALSPQQLKAWLDEAGIRQRVISVSACYSGSWTRPLADAHTLVMTAADDSHTSYGCGRGSELTYFGRAMFDEQLRRTRSFEAAHAAARIDIEARERAAGKTDGYSNPQIRVGAGIRGTLERLAAQQAARSP